MCQAACQTLTPSAVTKGCPGTADFLEDTASGVKVQVLPRGIWQAFGRRTGAAVFGGPGLGQDTTGKWGCPALLWWRAGERRRPSGQTDPAEV